MENKITNLQDLKPDETIDISGNTMFIKTPCGFCKKAMRVAERRGMEFKIYNLTGFKDRLIAISGRNTYPQIWVDGNHIGGCDDFLAFIGEVYQ